MSVVEREADVESDRGNRSAVRRLGAVGLWLLGVLLVLLLSVPLLLLPVSTAVPAWIWILLLLGDLALAFWVLRSRRPLAKTPGFGGLVLVAVMAVVASQVFAATPPIAVADGRPLPNSIASLEKVNLNGTEQWITIRGRDTRNPVLLNLGMGGPGGGGFATRRQFEPLEQHFTVVSWDEPGTGKSIGTVPLNQLTKERFVQDGRALTELLRQRFGQQRIYLYGVSWSSVLGIWLIQQYPQLYYAFVSSGQMVNTTENDQLGYRLALDYSRQRGDQRAVAKLEANGPPPYRGRNPVFRYLDYLDVLNDYMGSPRYALVVPPIPFFAPEYGLVDKVNHTRGLIDSFNVVYPQLADLDFAEQATKLQVPVYFFVGRNDVNAMASLVEDYYNKLSAPHKELIWLEGGHGLGSADPSQFLDVMVNQVRNQST
ncbi:MAG TPA: alpha/beta fold hydrolase [Propionibacteriaceae bacterium]|nr:alpha/beta fold hydrolase [Propionibacteriaceae bacterium]